MNKFNVEGYRNFKSDLRVRVDRADSLGTPVLNLTKEEACALRDQLNAALLGDGCVTHSQVEPKCYACQENARRS